VARPAYSSDRVDEIQRDILTAALHVFRRDGHRGLSLRAIAKQLGCTSAALYRYFDSKDRLLDAIRVDGYRRVEELLDSARRGASDPADAARRAMRAYLGFAAADSQTFRLMYDLHQGEVRSAPEVRVAREKAFDVARRIARDTIESGLLEGDPNLIAHVLWAGCHGLAALAMADQLDLGCSFEELVEPLVWQLTTTMRSEAQGTRASNPGEPQ
jgi:AcrR family transcriptional regulator